MAFKKGGPRRSSNSWDQEKAKEMAGLMETRFYGILDWEEREKLYGTVVRLQRALEWFISDGRPE